MSRLANNVPGEEGSSAGRSRERAAEKPEMAAAEGRSPQAERSIDETELFPAPMQPRYFGTGSYRTGGSNAEGNYGLGDVNPRGGYGSFTDAGGPGSTILLGEEEQEKRGPKGGS